LRRVPRLSAITPAKNQTRHARGIQTNKATKYMNVGGKIPTPRGFFQSEHTLPRTREAPNAQMSANGTSRHFARRRIWSLSGHSGHRSSRNNEARFMSTRPIAAVADHQSLAPPQCPLSTSVLTGSSRA
jgi:hypothetical protein